MTFSTSDLAGTGLSLSSISPSAVRIVGTPDTITALKTVTVTANAVETGASTSTTIKLAVLNDAITLSTPPSSAFAFVQNREITPVQIEATATLSERPITSFSSVGLPSGLGISPGGLITGIPSSSASGTAVLTATTGYAIGSNSYAFTVTPDSVLMQVTPATQTYSPGASLTIPIKASAYSGITPSNFAFSPSTPTYGLSIGSASGIITGPLSDSLPPSILLPASTTFAVTASAGVIDTSLSVAMVTQNPVVDRRYLFKQQAGLSDLYTTEDPSLNSWTLSTTFPKTRWLTDFQSKNSTVDSNVYLVCDSGQQRIFRSLSGRTFDTIPWEGTGFGSNDFVYTVRYQSSTGAWYAGGTTLYTDPNTSTTADGVSLYRSVDDGATWSSLTPGGLRLSPRQSSNLPNYYTSRGVTLSIANGVFLLGGGVDTYAMSDSPVLLRSVDLINWEQPLKAFQCETGTINTSGPVWVMTGSDKSSSGANYGMGAESSSTVRWSSDQGAHWEVGEGTICDFIGRDLAYASNTWISTGLTLVTRYAIKTMVTCSTDGMNWSEVNLGETFTEQTLVDNVDYKLEATSPWFDGSNWNLVVKRQSLTSPVDQSCKIYTHPITGDLTTGWTVRASNVAPFNGDTTEMILSGYQQHYIRTGVPTLTTFTFDQLTGTGPTMTAPVQGETFVAYQYIPIQPIQISGTGTGTVYFFILSADLPQGLMFDPLTNTVTGTSVKLGTITVTGYAKDTIGITPFTFTVETILPSVLRVQSNASAYTALLRQYTIVNATQNARDNRALPAGDRLLGEFTAPVGPDVITQTVDPRCLNPECK
jgi:hypothetical protein